MNSNRLRYLITLCKTESIRKAAEFLHISPAALSKAMKQLEEEIGLSLVIPSGRGIIITEQGREFALRVEPLILGIDTLAKEIKEKNSPHKINMKPFRIGSFGFASCFLSRLADIFSCNNNLLLRTTHPGELEKNLLTRDIDTVLPIFQYQQLGLCIIELQQWKYKLWEDVISLIMFHF